MQSRRSFIGSILAAGAALVCGKVVLGAPRREPRIPGVNYFKAAHPTDWRRYDLPAGKSIYFNGEDFKCRANEADLVEGWVVAFDVESTSPLVLKTSPARKRYGRVEVR